MNKKYNANDKYVVYSRSPLYDGCECFFNNNHLKSNEYYISNVKLCHIRENENKFYYTTEDLSQCADWFPASIISVGNFVPAKKRKKNRGCIVDVSNLPAFNGSQFDVNEDAKIYEYRFYITLFNDYTVKQCQYERHNLFDAKYNSSKFDLVSKMQNSEMLKSKDFTAINVKRKDEENVTIGWIIKEPEIGEVSSDYGIVTIDMDNKLSIKWH